MRTFTQCSRHLIKHDPSRRLLTSLSRPSRTFSLAGARSFKAREEEEGGLRRKDFTAVDGIASTPYGTGLSAMRASPASGLPVKLSLLPAEALLRDLLLDYRRDVLKDGKVQDLNIWFVGGWVRDRLLGLETIDIDVALSSMTGMTFGLGLEQFFRSEAASKHISNAAEIGLSTKFKLSRVDANPAKSKHLETGVASVFGLEIDFVNLRGETYSEDSRNPQMQFATAEEDALRRDLTINALFYNIVTGQVQDFTGHGLNDLRTGIIQTPLEPRQTFLDDPLRLLRVIRFTSRLGFDINDNVRNAMNDNDIHVRLDKIISRERIRDELIKMMKGRNPDQAFAIISSINLYSTIFIGNDSKTCRALLEAFPDDDSNGSWPASWPSTYTLLKKILSSQTCFDKLSSADHAPELKWLMAAYAPLAVLNTGHHSQAMKDVTEAMKLTRTEMTLMDICLKNKPRISLEAQKACRAFDAGSELSRADCGMLVRHCGPTWRLQFLFAILADMFTASDSVQSDTVIHHYSILLEAIVNRSMENAHEEVIAVDGSDILKHFKLTRGGAFMRPAIEALARRQFETEDLSKTTGLAWLEERKDQYGIP